MGANPSPYAGGGAPAGAAGGDLGSTYPNPTVLATHLSAGLPIAQGGTGQVTQQAAINALAGAQTANQVLAGNGTNIAVRALAAADLPTVPIAQGGTGQVTQQAALNALAATQTSGQYLRGTGTNVAMSAIQSADVPVPNGATNGWNSVYLAPPGALAETFPRYLALAISAQPTTGTLYLTAIPLLANQVVANLNILIGTTQASVITHSWMILTDSNYIVRAVTSDNTSTVVSQAIWTQAATGAYTVPTSGLYYFGVMFACTNRPTYMYTNVTNSTAIGGLIAPSLSGVSSTSQAAPPVVGATMTTISPGGSVTPTYAYVS